jgi:hypothetical protein
MPELNALIASLANEPNIVFITPSNESLADLDAWSEKQPMKAALVRDVDGSTFEAFARRRRSSPGC